VTSHVSARVCFLMKNSHPFLFRVFCIKIGSLLLCEGSRKKNNYVNLAMRF
jgi:hypothetical protein